MVFPFYIKPEFVFIGTYIYENDIYYLLPDCYVALGTIFCTMYGVYYSTEKEYGYPSLHQIFPMLGSFLCLGGLFLLWTTPFQNGILCNHTLLYDGLSIFFKTFLLGGAAFFFIICQKNFATLPLNNFEYILLLLCSITSMLFLISGFDFLTIYLTIELQALCFYVCAASKKHSEFSTEAGLKYFLLGAFSSGLLLFGMAWIYGFTGMIHFSDLFLFATFPIEKDQSIPILVGFLFLFFGFLFKLTAAPFHIWAPDVYEGTPTGITAFFATFPKIGLLPPFWKILFLVLKIEEGTMYTQTMEPLLLFCVFLSIGIGTFAALAQRKIKRILAYSSIAHIGYILLGFACASSGGFQSVLIYYPIYMAATLGIFSILLTPQWNRRINGQEEGFGGKYLTDFAGIGKRTPLLGFIFSMFFFSLAGIPPLAGFYSKAFLFFTAIFSGLFYIALFSILTSVCSCFYYIRFIRIFYFEKEIEGVSLQFFGIPKGTSYVIPICFFFIACQPIWWHAFFKWTSFIALTLYLET
jgi:proton-translocating NADH-quinone oxidoreductase chain N